MFKREEHGASYGSANVRIVIFSIFFFATSSRGSNTRVKVHTNVHAAPFEPNTCAIQRQREREGYVTRAHVCARVCVPDTTADRTQAHIYAHVYRVFRSHRLARAAARLIGRVANRGIPPPPSTSSRVQGFDRGRGRGVQPLGRRRALARAIKMGHLV